MVQHVLITAGASGIGLAMAEAFAASGAKIWVCDIDQEAVNACPEEWERDCLDVTNEQAVRALFDRLESKWGRLDIMCCNAGVAGPTARLEDIDMDGLQHCLMVNIQGGVLFAQGAARIMKPQGSGAILFTSSTAGINGFPNRAPYAAAKWGVHGLMKTVAMELGPFGIRANAICPGAVEGPRIEGVFEREAKVKGTTRDVIYEGYASGTSMQSLVEAKDIANMAVFLASEGARFVSGQIIAVDGHTENPDPKI